MFGAISFRHGPVAFIFGTIRHFFVLIWSISAMLWLFGLFFLPQNDHKWFDRMFWGRFNPGNFSVIACNPCNPGGESLSAILQQCPQFPQLLPFYTIFLKSCCFPPSSLVVVNLSRDKLPRPRINFFTHLESTNEQPSNILPPSNIDWM